MSTPRGTLPESWRIQLPAFEGPLDLLLQLVRINEVEISDIPVAVICDQFHEYLHLMDELDLDIAAEYIFEAAQLIQLKSRMVLPSSVGELGDAEDDPRQELVARLLEYQRLKEAAQSLAEVHSLRKGIWTRPHEAIPALDDESESIDLGDVSLYDLLYALQTVLARHEHEHPEPLRLPRESFSVRDQFERLIAALDDSRPFDLLADLRQRCCRAEVVAAFLAVLELARLQLVRFHQTELCDLVLYRTSRKVHEHELEAIQG